MTSAGLLPSTAFLMGRRAITSRSSLLLSPRMLLGMGQYVGRRDCHRFRRRRNGDIRDQRIPIPVALVPHASPDGRIRICFRSLTGDLNLAPSCLFLPAQS